MNQKRLISIMYFIPFFSCVATASPQHEIQCPKSITETPNVVITDKKWTVLANTGERYLENVAIYVSHLGEYSSQVPDETKQSKKQEIVTWNINHTPEFTFWVGCSYTGTSAILLHEVKHKAKSCTAIYELLPSGKQQRLETLYCQ